MKNIERKTAAYYQKLEDKKLKCELCGNECILSPEMVSRCLSRKNEQGEMILNNYAMVSSIAVDPIEKKPLYHFYPGTKVFSLGGWGCNFNCLHCQNWQISQPKKNNQRETYYIPPEEAIALTIKNDSQGICWTYNEPAIWFEYTLESAKLAKESGLYTAYVTNGFMNEKPLREIAPFLDAYRVDFKGFDDNFYLKLCSIKNWMKIYKNTVIAKELGIHVEVITNIVPEYNDSEETLNSIAKFTAENLGTDTPWHVTRFFPNHKINSIEPTPLSTIDKAVEIGQKHGLKFIYKGNCPSKSETVCPECNNIVVQRDFYVKTDLDSNCHCKKCGTPVNIRCK